MSKSNERIFDFCEDKTRAGDGVFAVAYALLEVAKQQRAVAVALDKMGMNNLNSHGARGALEEIGMQLKAISGSLQQMVAK